MPTAQGGPKPLGPFRATARWMSHYTAWFVGLNAVSALGARLTDGWMMWGFVVLGWLWLVALYGDRVHMRHWDCSVCVERSPIFDGEEQVKKRLHALHFLHTPKKMLGALVIGYGTWFGLDWLLSPGAFTYALITLPYYGIWAYMCWAAGVHRDLQRWCPWCRGGRGDDGPVEVVPPTPVGENTR